MQQNDEALRIKSLEQSLINFLSEKKDFLEKMGAGLKRIRGLQIRLEGEGADALFIVQIGIFEAEFNVLTGLKEKGSCYGLERPIRDWSERESVKAELLAMTAIKASSSGNAGIGAKLIDNIGFLL